MIKRLTILLLLWSSAGAVTWPFTDLSWTGNTDSFKVKTYADGVLQPGTITNTTGATTYSTVLNAQSGKYNQAVILIYYAGFSRPSGWGFDWDLNTAFSAESLWTREAYWSSTIDSARWRFTRAAPLGTLDTVGTGKLNSGTYSFDTGFACTNGQYNRLTITFYYPGSTKGATWEFVRDLEDTTSGSSVSPTPNYCRVSGWVFGIDNTPLENATVTFSLVNAQVNDTCNDVIIGSYSAGTKTNINGYFQKDIAYSACLGGSLYQVTIKKGSYTRTKQFAVPSTASYQLVW